MWDMAASFLIGLFGSLHCMGMCGPLVVAYSVSIKGHGGQEKHRQVRASLFHHVGFHSGRLLTYGFLGGLAAALFSHEGFSRLFLNLRGGITLSGGVLMVLLGATILKILPLPALVTAPLGRPAGAWSRLILPLFRSRSPISKMVLGLATGFLPCGLSWAMIVKAATAEKIGEGFLTMLAFGVGTVPLLFMTGFSTSFVSLKVRAMGERIAGMAVIVMGCILILKGVRVLV